MGLSKVHHFPGDRHQTVGNFNEKHTDEDSSILAFGNQLLRENPELPHPGS